MKIQNTNTKQNFKGTYIVDKAVFQYASKKVANYLKEGGEADKFIQSLDDSIIATLVPGSKCMPIEAMPKKFLKNLGQEIIEAITPKASDIYLRLFCEPDTQTAIKIDNKNLETVKSQLEELAISMNTIANGFKKPTGLNELYVISKININ